MFLYICIRFGCCEVIILDQGKEFVNKVKDQLLYLTQAHHKVSSAYHSQTNGLTERFNQTLQASLIKVVNNSQGRLGWHLSAVLFAYRTSIQKDTKLTPFEIVKSIKCKQVHYFCFLSYHAFIQKTKVTH